MPYQPFLPYQPLAPGESLGPTILYQAPLPETVPPGGVPAAPVIPGAVPAVEGAPPPANIPSTPTRLLPVLPTELGAVRPVFRFQPALSLSEEYTDNFDLTKTNRHSNFRTAIAPTTIFSLDSAFTKGIVAYTFTANRDTFQDEWLYFHSLLGQFSWQATQRLRFTIADSFTHNDQPLEADALGLRRQRGAFTTNALSFSADYKIDRVETREYYRWNTFSDDSTGGTSTTTQVIGASALFPLYLENLATLGYSYLTSHTSQSSGSTSTNGGTQGSVGSQDVSGHEVTVSFAHTFNPLVTAGVTGSYAIRDVTGDLTNNGNFQLWNAALYGTYGTLPFTVTGKVGVTGLNSDTNGSRGPDLTMAINATYAWTRTVLSFAADHGFSETFQSGENFGVVETTGVGATLTHSFTPRTSLTLNAYYRKTETTGIGGGQSVAGGPNVSSSNQDVNESVGASARLTVSLLRWLFLNLAYTYTQRFDNGATGTTTTTSGTTVSNQGYTENRGRISFDFVF